MASTESNSGNRKSSKFLGRALSHRNYRLWFGGQGTSLIGTWMQMIAMSWLVYRLTNSPFLLSLVTFTGSVPMFLFASIAGTFVDGWNRHKLLIATQTAAMVQAGILAALTLTGHIAIWHIFVLSFFLGVDQRL